MSKPSGPYKLSTLQGQFITTINSQCLLWFVHLVLPQMEVLTAPSHISCVQHVSGDCHIIKAFCQGSVVILACPGGSIVWKWDEQS